MLKKELIIEGMSCGHCVKHVEDALKEIEEVQDVIVSSDRKKAIISLKGQTDEDKLKKAVEEAGYTVIQVKTV